MQQHVARAATLICVGGFGRSISQKQTSVNYIRYCFLQRTVLAISSPDAVQIHFVSKQICQMYYHQILAYIHIRNIYTKRRYVSVSRTVRFLDVLILYVSTCIRVLVRHASCGCYHRPHLTAHNYWIKRD